MEEGRTVSFLGKYMLDFRYSVVPLLFSRLEFSQYYTLWSVRSPSLDIFIISTTLFLIYIRLRLSNHIYGGLSDYRLSDLQFGKTIGLSDIRLVTQTIKLSDIWLPKSICCPALLLFSVFFFISNVKKSKKTGLIFEPDKTNEKKSSNIKH